VLNWKEKELIADGGWYAVLEVPRTRDEDAWVELLARADGVIVHPATSSMSRRKGRWW
jgi:hypothetical protein